MANNSLTERVLSANERGVGVEEISLYENLPREDVEHILKYWKSEYHAASPRRQSEVDKFITRRGAGDLCEFVERTTEDAPRGNTRAYVASELAHRYNLRPEVAYDVVEEIYLMMDNLRNERRVSRRDTTNYITRIRRSA